jgi:hypothetical protein
MTNDKPLRYTRITPGKYSVANPWGRVSPGGTQLCRFYELADALEAELMLVLSRRAGAIEDLIFTPRPHNVSSIQWRDDPLGAYAIGSGLIHHPATPEENLRGFLWLQYRTEGPVDVDERPLDVRLIPGLARDAELIADLIFNAARLHRRIMRFRGLVPA